MEHIKKMSDAELKLEIMCVEQQIASEGYNLGLRRHLQLLLKEKRERKLK